MSINNNSNINNSLRTVLRLTCYSNYYPRQTILRCSKPRRTTSSYWTSLHQYNKNSKRLLSYSYNPSKEATLWWGQTRRILQLQRDNKAPALQRSSSHMTWKISQSKIHLLEPNQRPHLRQWLRARLWISSSLLKSRLRWQVTQSTLTDWKCNQRRARLSLLSLWRHYQGSNLLEACQDKSLKQRCRLSSRFLILISKQLIRLLACRNFHPEHKMRTQVLSRHPRLKPSSWASALQWLT